MKSDALKTAALLLCLWSPSLVLVWTDHALGPSELLAVAGFGLWLLLLPLLLVARLRLYFWLCLPLVPLLPAYLYICLWFRSVPGDALVSAALNSGLAQSLEMMRVFGWKLLLIPLALLAYIGVAWRIDPRYRLSLEGRKRLLAALLVYALVGTAGRQALGLYLPLPPLFDERAASLAFPSSLVLSAARSLEHQRQLSLVASVQGRLSEDAAPALLVVLVLGESVRADHLGLNGYARNTTPRLSALGEELLSFTQVASTAQWTAGALPNIVSRPWNGGRASLTQTFGEAGFRTAWFSNQERSPLSSAAEVVEHAEGARDFHLRRDAALLPMFESFVSQAGPRQFVVLHMIGSHFPYEERYGAESRVFMPVLPSLKMGAEPGPALKAEAINSYDNTIVETDRFLHALVARLAREQRPALLLYTSDHGENLFDDERQLFMHALPTPTRHDLDVPLLVWANRAYRAAYPGRWQALQANRGRKISHPDVFPSLLDLGRVDWTGQRPQDSLASPSFEEKPRRVITLSGPDYAYESVR